MLTDRALMESRRQKTGLQALAAVIGLGLIFAIVWFVWLGGGGETTIHAQPPSYYTETFGSDPADVQALLVSSDCGLLDARRLQAADAYAASGEDSVESSAQLGLMTAAADRMDDLGCPK